MMQFGRLEKLCQLKQLNKALLICCALDKWLTKYIVAQYPVGWLKVDFPQKILPEPNFLIRKRTMAYHN